MSKIQGRLIINESNCRGCLSCQLACSFVKNKSFNPMKSCIKIVRNVEDERTFPMIIRECCDLCGGHPTCAEVCPYDAIRFENDGCQFE
jgi:Fe-S-cluster-containing dehydrogenase component